MSHLLETSKDGWLLAFLFIQIYKHIYEAAAAMDLLDISVKFLIIESKAYDSIIS